MFLAPHLDKLWSVEAQSSTKPTPKNNEELIRLYQEDQADRAPRTAIDWKVVGPRDQGPSVTDGLRRALDVPSLAEATAREAEFNKKE